MHWGFKFSYLFEKLYLSSSKTKCNDRYTKYWKIHNIVSFVSGNSYLFCLSWDTTMVMPSAHDRFFCRTQLREKIGPIFTSDQKWAHTDRFFIGAIVCDNNRRGPIVGWHHSDFFSDWSQRTRTDFCRKQLREKIGAILYWSKSQRTRTNFHSDFLSTTKNRSVCAGHYDNR